MQKATSKKTTQIISQKWFGDSILLSKNLPKMFKILKSQLSSPILKSLEILSSQTPGTPRNPDIGSLAGVHPAGKGETCVIWT